MDFGLFDKDIRRRCYLRVSTLEKLWGDPKVLDALVDRLEVPGKPAVLNKLSTVEKQTAIELQIDHFRRTKTSRWYGVESLEILAASVFMAEKMPRTIINTHFHQVRKEADLAAPIHNFLKAKGLTSVSEVPLGMNRADVLGFREHWWHGTNAIAVELKN